MSDRMLPYSEQAERGVIGSILIDEDAIWRIGFLQPTDFYNGQNRAAFEALLQLASANRPLDIIAVSDLLSSRTDNSAEDWSFKLIGYVNETPTSINIREYAQTVADKAIRRRMIRAAGDIAKLGYDESGSIISQLDEAETAIFQVRGERSREGIAQPRQYAQRYLAHLEESYDEGQGIIGLSTGYIDIDRVLSGFQAPHQYILAARPGMGKSALAMNIAVNAGLNHDKRIAIFNMEMSETQLMNRMISYMTRMSSNKIQKPWLQNEIERRVVYDATGRISDSHIYLDTSPRMTPSQIRAKCLRLDAEFGLDLVIIDHLHIMDPDTSLNNRALEYGDMTQTLAQLGKTLNAPILTLAQLSRGVEARKDKHPMLSDLRESGRIEENAFVVMFLYRDDYYVEGHQRAGIADLSIAKNREGPTGMIELAWLPGEIAFRSLAAGMIAEAA